MKPQAERFVEKARKLLTEAETMLRVGLNDAAARTAYLAGYHAAQALIFQRLSRVLKTHSGVHSEFLRLTKDDPGIDGELRMFLSRSYNLKAIADYETGARSEIAPERAAAAVATSKLFVAHVVTRISVPGGDP